MDVPNDCTVKEEPFTECESIKIVKQFPKDFKEIGKGEQGTAYKYYDKVLKESKLETKMDKKKWINEACIGKELGEKQIAPIIYDCFLCENSGYLMMEKLTDAKRFHGQQIRVKSADGSNDNLMLLPLAVQQAFVEKFRVMIDLGYIHLDNHIENLGFVTRFGVETPILFDFGFTQKRHFSNEEKKYAMALTCFITLEHQQLDNLDQTVFFQEGMNQLFGEKDGGWTTADLMPFQQQTINGLQIIDELINNYKFKTSTKNKDIIVGALAHLFFLGLPREERYDTAMYDLTYLVRRNEYKDLSKTNFSSTPYKRTATTNRKPSASARRRRGGTKKKYHKKKYQNKTRKQFYKTQKKFSSYK